MANWERGPFGLRTTQEGLPIAQQRVEIREAILRSHTIIVVGETGSGKTTQIPLMFLDALSPRAKIAITEPRRLAATSVARFVAGQRGSRLGGEVGYQVRFDDQTGLGTRLNFYTDGLLLRKIQADPQLLEFDAVMVDEAHERNLDTDFLLGLLKSIQRRRKEGARELKIAVASATMEESKFAAFLDDAPIIRIPGRQYPVAIHYEAPGFDYVSTATQRAIAIVQSGDDGNILIFMPGVEEINRTIRVLRQHGVYGSIILPLHGQLTAEEQDRVFEDGSQRKIIVTTNIAETSVTIPNVRFVIDAGFIRQIEFNPETGIEALVTVPHAQSGAIQRAGRAGRTAPGECYRLYSEQNYQQRPPFQRPEIQRVNLGRVVLLMKKLGINDIEKFEFVDQPPKELLTQAIETLQFLGALDDEGNLTQVGSLMAEFPLEPHASRTVVEAIKKSCIDEVCTIMAFNGLRSVFAVPFGQKEQAEQAHRRFRVDGSDFLTLLRVWKLFVEQKMDEGWAHDNFLNYSTLREAGNIRLQLLAILGRFGIKPNREAAPEAIAKSIIAGHADNLLVATKSRSYKDSYKLIRGGSTVFIHPSSVLFGSNATFAVASQIVRIDNGVRAHLCQVVEPGWISEVASQLLIKEQKPQLHYSKTGEVVERVPVCLKGDPDHPISFFEKPAVSPLAARVFANALAQGIVSLPEEIIRHNKGVMERARDFWIRSAGRIPRDFDPAKVFTAKELTAVFVGRIGNITSRLALLKAMKEGRVDIRLQMEDYIPSDLQEEIVSGNPDTITIGGRTYSIGYTRKGRFSAHIVVGLEDLPLLPDDLALPNGRQVYVSVRIENEQSGRPLSVSQAKEKHTPNLL